MIEPLCLAKVASRVAKGNVFGQGDRR